MAIIRIKRTTGNSLPTGLTFGELAFVQGSGGTANRLYIADSAGVCVWVGAEILKSPRYWTGLTADTTVPTVSAVEARVVAGGGLTFATDLNVNIDVGKFFGKYKKGDVIPATGLTVKEVIEDALNERITPGVKLLASTSSIPFGQTTGINYTLTVEYQIKTVGATALGATLEWKRGTSADWASYPGVFYDNTDPFTPAGTTYTHSPSPNGISTNTLYNTDSFQYRYSVHDSSGASATSSVVTVTVQSYAAPTVTSFSAAASTLLTAETNSIRERGNSYSNITGTITSTNTYVPLTFWKLQFSENGGAFADTNKPSAGWQAVTPNAQTATINTNHTPPTTGLSKVDYRVLVSDTYQNSQGTTATVTPTPQPGISFGYRIFYGPTGSIPSTSVEIRGLPGVCMASGSAAAPNPFTLNTGSTFLNFVVALPKNVTVSGVIDRDLLGGQSITDSYAAQTDINVADREGGTKAYNIYRFTAGITYADDAGDAGDGHRHEISRTGSVT